ncbi:MAG: zinc-ribbon domain-containing protein [Oscillospiraceae bacterium]|nr:zinc-ribbon domain-containing protein [Oscillospiraceae bacterium]
MYCMTCGAEIPEGSEFCIKCGASQTDLPVPVETEEYPACEAAPEWTWPVTPTNVLVWAILGLAFACTFYLSFLGIIFSAIGMKKHRAYLESGAPYSTKVKVGGILSKVGLGVGIGLTALFLLYLTAIAVWLVFMGRLLPLDEIISEIF